MDARARQGSKTLTLIAVIQNVSGETFAERCATYMQVLDARISRTVQGDPEWHDLIRLKGHVQNMIRFDSQPIVLEEEPSETALVAVG